MNGHTAVTAELGLRLVAAEQTIVPLVASLYYSGSDPYAVRAAFHVGTDEPVEWIFARELLAAGISAAEGVGDVRIWPSTGEGFDGPATRDRFDPSPPDEPPRSGLVGPCWSDTADAGGDARTATDVVHIELSSPFGRAHFEASAEALAEFLYRTYQVVPLGREHDFVDLDAELANLLA